MKTASAYAGGEAPCRLGRAGLHEHRAALRAAGDVERRRATWKCLPAWSSGVDLVRVGVAPRSPCRPGRVVLPAVPELGDDVEELVGPVVPLGVRRASSSRLKLRARRRGRGGDDVPAGPAAADVVERGEPAGQVERLVVGRGRRGDQSDVLGHRGDRRQQGRSARGLGRSSGRRCRPERRAVGEEDASRACRARRSGRAPGSARRPRAATGRSRVPPGGLVVADAHQEGVEVQLPGHGCSSGVLRRVQRRSTRTPAREAALEGDEAVVDGQAEREMVMIPAYICGIRKLYCA